jgi:hypothetical protein
MLGAGRVASRPEEKAKEREGRPAELGVEVIC